MVKELQNAVSYKGEHGIVHISSNLTPFAALIRFVTGLSVKSYF
ncbi:MAG: hypothetical protein H6Q41_3716 [Deltaproteobacteria bacterium]|jgi:hypothetical protein|nr:hypothetical protein [Deltaproteobacteria bacterium]